MGVREPDFVRALKWLAHFGGIPFEAQQAAALTRQAGLQEFRSLVASAPRSSKFDAFAAERAFDPAWLKNANTAIVSLSSL
jgi:hypothetical protein